jgi:hypothetical protein
MCSISYKHAYANGKQKYSWLQFQYFECIEMKCKLFNVHICIYCRRAFVWLVIFTGGLLSAQSFLREGFCPPCHFHRRAFVRPVIFTGGLLSALSFLDGRAFVREGFCPTLVKSTWPEGAERCIDSSNSNQFSQHLQHWLQFWRLNPWRQHIIHKGGNLGKTPK